MSVSVSEKVELYGLSREVIQGLSSMALFQRVEYICTLITFGIYFTQAQITIQPSILEYNENFTVTCSYTGLSSNNLKKIEIFFGNETGPKAIYQGGQSPVSYDKRYHVEIEPKTGHPTKLYSTVLADCSDMDKYRCDITYDDSNGTDKTASKSIKITSIKVPIQGGVHVIEPDNYEIMEDEGLGFICFGNVGRTVNNTAGKVMWQIKQQSKIITLDPNDTRISTYINESSSVRCSFDAYSELDLSEIKRDMDGAQIMCHLFNQEFNSTVPSNCTTSGDPNSHCRLFLPIVVLYPVSEDDISITREPSTEQILVGTTVDLACKCKNSQAELIWEEVGDENKNLDQRTLDDGQVVISVPTKLENIEDITYEYRCVATNEISNVTYSANKTTSFTVVLTVTAPSAETTTASKFLKSDADDNTILVTVLVPLTIVAVTVSAISAYHILNRGKSKLLPESPPENQDQDNMTDYDPVYGTMV